MTKRWLLRLAIGLRRIIASGRSLLIEGGCRYPLYHRGENGEQGVDSRDKQLDASAQIRLACELRLPGLVGRVSFPAPLGAVGGSAVLFGEGVFGL